MEGEGWRRKRLIAWNCSFQPSEHTWAGGGRVLNSRRRFFGVTGR